MVLPYVHVFGAAALVSAVTAVIVLLCLHFFYVDHPAIKGLPEIPGGELLAGHLYQLGADHATTAEDWSKKYGWPAFQLRMGRRRAIMLNSFQSAHEFLVKNQSATLDRPWFYTFHGLLSKTSAATIGTSPWDERTKKQRRVIGSYTTGPSIQQLRSMLDMETCAVVSSMYYKSNSGEFELIPHIYLQRLALNLMSMFCYGTRFSNVDDPTLLQILKDAKTIASFRSTNSNAPDFIPHLRYLSGNNGRLDIAKEVRGRRDVWLAAMLEGARQNTGKQSMAKQTVAEMLLTDKNEGLTELDVKTILGGLMSGGFETTYSTAIIALGVLSRYEGQAIQQRAYKELLSVYDSVEEAFDKCVTEEKCPYVMGIVKESLRYFPPLKLLPARQTYKDIVYQGAVIPKGVLIYTNTQAISRDTSVYGADAGQFKPERWLTEKCQIPPPLHFAFGAGARMCTAVNFSNRILYAMTCRLILSFRFTESKTMPANIDYIDYKNDPSDSNAIAKEFKVKLTVRDRESLERCFQRSQEIGAAATGGLPYEALFRG
ncbi:uncharacterized protein A1O9_02069 [Exophiala aquamarina CBS 119918]|uniref:Phenylacetate 2-hydroxylase n=1 Tax=Exophiala aquamarina CBS 119918 TaxID=1182545 RepID=A0A072PME2_9EURO|nr:uncharacterized protein A1O9_02069 [Exophiala aquamarina CBS 119918]KEF60508.1 hypothetical protein A1O9_02069 [Exophiala aquamarina CBS 119918]